MHKSKDFYRNSSINFNAVIRFNDPKIELEMNILIKEKKMNEFRSVAINFPSFFKRKYKCINGM